MDTTFRTGRSAPWPAAFHATALGLCRLALAVDAAWRRTRRHAHAAQDLANMSDRDLADIGITRSDVPRVFDQRWPQGL